MCRPFIVSHLQEYLPDDDADPNKMDVDDALQQMTLGAEDRGHESEASLDVGGKGSGIGGQCGFACFS